MGALETVVLGTLSSFNSEIQQRLGVQWFGIALWQYIGSFLLILLSLFARRMADSLLNRVLLPRLKNIRAGWVRRGIEALSKPLTGLLSVIGFYIAVKVLMIPTGPDQREVLVSQELVNQSFEIALAIILMWAVLRIIDVLGAAVQERVREEDLDVDVPVIPLLQKSVKIFVGVVGGLLIIQHAGYPILGLLGGLGIGGLAIALAAQDTLSNVFGSVIIFTDRPFKVGDWVVIGDVEGFVETIGFRSTRIRTWPKALVTVPNKLIANTHITNWTEMPLRRVSFDLKVGYGATADQMERLVTEITRIIEAHPGVDQGYHLVQFREFGPEGMEILVYYFTASVVWKEHLIVRQEINLAIMRLMDEIGVSIGLPGRDIFMIGEGTSQ